MVKWLNVRSILSSVHALNQLANFAFTTLLSIFRWKTNKCESLGRSWEKCSSDVLMAQLQRFIFVRPTNRPHDHASTFAGAWNFAFPLRLVFSGRKVPIEFSSKRDPQTCLCPHRSYPTRSCLHIHTLAWKRLRRHLQNVPTQSFTSGSQHEIFWGKSSDDTSQKSFSTFQDLFVFNQDVSN